MLIYDTYINYYWHKFNFTKERYGIKELLDYLFKIILTYVHFLINNKIYNILFILNNYKNLYFHLLNNLNILHIPLISFFPMIQ